MTKRRYVLRCARELREVIDDRISKLPGTVAVALSGGVDSASLVLAALQSGRSVVGYTFALEDRDPEDLRRSRIVAERLSIDHRIVRLPTDLETLKDDVRRVIGYGTSRKPDVECLIPILRLVDAVEEESIVTGLAADGYFALSKSASIKYRNSPETLDDFRSGYFDGPIVNQHRIIREYAESKGLVESAPYIDERLLDVFAGSSWKDLNRWRQKTPIWLAFPELQSLPIKRTHLNLQLGDSGIETLFRKLLDTEWNLGDWKTTGPIYRAISDGRIE